MRTGASGAMTMRHVGLVALEALLVAVIVWLAAMTLAGATQNGGIVGAAEAGDPASLTVASAQLGGTAVFTAHPGDEGMWVHATCVQSTTTVLNQWARVDATHHAALPLAPSAGWSAGSAACTAEEGYFSSNGRWRVIAATTFTVVG